MNQFETCGYKDFSIQIKPGSQCAQLYIQTEQRAIANRGSIGGT